MVTIITTLIICATVIFITVFSIKELKPKPQPKQVAQPPQPKQEVKQPKPRPKTTTGLTRDEMQNLVDLITDPGKILEEAYKDGTRKNN